MFSLMKNFREKVGKDKDPRMSQEAVFDVSYATGFLGFDFLNGTVVHVKQGEKKFKYNSIGIVDGSITMVIGRSGCGKTTWLVQTAGNILRRFDKAGVWHDDIEGGIVETRKERLTGLFGPDLKDRYLSRNSGVNTESVYERIKIIHDLKLENREEYEYDTGLYTSRGEKIYKLQPSIYILDSLAMLTPDKFSEQDELSGQMAATATAKANADLFRKVVPLLKSANIMLFVVNHITQNIDINPMAKKKAKLSYLKQDESLPGGNTPIYLANLLIRFDDNTKLKDSEGLGIAGNVVDLTLLKSRTSNVGKSIPLIFDHKRGFDAELSLLQLLKDMKLVNGAGAYLYLKDRNDIKFSQKQFKNKLGEDAEFRKLFMEVALEALEELIYDPGEDFEEEFNESSVTDGILDLMKIA